MQSPSFTFLFHFNADLGRLSMNKNTRLSLISIILFALLLVFSGFKISQSLSPEPAKQPNKTIWSVDWSTNGKWIATGGVDSTVRILNPVDLSVHKRFKLNSWIHVVKWHPNNNLLAIATLENHIILLDVATGSMKQLADNGGSRAIGWNHDGEMLAVGDIDGGVSIWNKDGKLLKSISYKYPDDQVGRAFLSLDWHPSKNIFVANNFQINVYDDSGNRIRTMQHRNPKAIMLSADWHPSGSYFVIGDYGYNEDAENVPSLLHFWTENGEYMRAVEGSKAEYRNIAWDRSGKRLATASDKLRIWDEKGKLLSEAPNKSGSKLWGIDWNAQNDAIAVSNTNASVITFTGLTSKVSVLKEKPLY
jgi:WD40 repeat protein